jgi:Protoglobin
MSEPNANPQIPGYEFGTPRSAASPLSDEDLRNLEQTVGWAGADHDILLKHAALFRLHAEEMVDSWRSVIAAQPHLTHWFVRPDGKSDDDYKARVKRRFVQWVIDVAVRPHDRDWLNYQEEIGLRHTPAKKNLTDAAQTPPLVPLRYLLGFVPVVLPLRSFFRDSIQNDTELNRLEAAWIRAVLLHITLWSRPYTAPGLW